LGLAHFAAGRYFHAHEAWETAWKQSRDTEDAEFFKGLSQLGAGYTHLLRGNSHGAITLLRRGRRRIAEYAPGHRGVDTAAAADQAERDARAVERGDLGPGPRALTEPRTLEVSPPRPGT
jgi:predicted metal-dependent hydrolase